MALLTQEQLRQLNDYYATLPEQTVDWVATRGELERVPIQPLSAYPRARRGTRRGMHGTAEVDRPFGSEPGRVIDELYGYGFDGITALLNPGGDTIGIAHHALNKGMWASIRMYRDRPNPGGLTGEQKATLTRVAPDLRGKAAYIITNNEPDLPWEWQNDHMPANWLEVVARNAMADARFVQGLGLIYVLPAAATGSPGFYQYRLIPKILELGGADIFRGLIMFGVHDYAVGHPVGGIEHESETYPYDDVNQAGRAVSDAEFRAYGDVWRAWETDNPASVSGERSRNKNPGQKHTDPGGASGVVALWQQYELNVVAAGLQGLPVISTEGGEWHDVRNDGRYPRVNPELRVKRMLEIARRCRGSSMTRWNYPPEFIGNADWLLEDDRAGSPWQGGGYYSFGQVRDEYRHYFVAHKAITEGSTPPGGGTGGTTPPTTPATEPTFINFTEEVRRRITFTPATVAVGQRYWRLKSIEYLDEQAAGGTHHLYSMNPHDRRFNTRVSWSSSYADAPHEKPTDEPAANFAMFGEGFAVQLRSPDGLPSDSASGFGMYGSRHVSFKFVWEEVTKEGGTVPPTTPTKTLEDTAFEEMTEHQLRVTPTFALPSAIIRYNDQLGDNRKGFDFVTPELRFDYSGVRYAMMGAQHPVSEAKLVAYAKDGDWRNVQIKVRLKTTQLEIPYQRQIRDTNVDYARGDCGPAVLTSYYKSKGLAVHVDTLSREADKIQNDGTPGFSGLTLKEMQQLAALRGTRLLRRDGMSKTDCLIEFASDNPFIALINYEAMPEAHKYDKGGKVGGHYVLPVGMDGEYIIYHDPYWNDGRGAYRRMKYVDFDKAWVAASKNGNPQRCGLLFR